MDFSETDNLDNNENNQEAEPGLEPIAIIGMACRVPGADSIEQFWQNLCEGVESISRFTNEELLAEGIDPALLENPAYIKAAGRVANIDQFAASFFGIPPREAQVMNPQQRLFLECAWQAVEHSGYYLASGHYEGRVGVYAGAGMNAYLYRNLATNPQLMQNVDGYQVFTGNDKDFLPTRTSYLLDLKGPSINVNTACSSSLVAVHLACQGLWNYQTDMALAGGVTLNVPEKEGYLYQAGGIRSADGHCCAFDAKASGTVSGSGVGVVLLKRLSDAQADGDTIHAVIRGSAVNNDGANKVGFTAPSIEGQMEVITEAQALAEIDPATISYVEAHGTGTALGDPIEMAALTKAFYRSGSQAQGKTQYCAIGSVKTNIGHLDTAAGVVGLIKTVLALKYKTIPASLHYQIPNPKIDFANSPFYVNATCADWPAQNQPRRAGVSSFGIGGTNAHVILEEALNAFPLPGGRSESGAQLLTWSAQTPTALQRMTENLADYCANPEQAFSLANMAYTLAVGRKPFPCRQFLVVPCQDDHDSAAKCAALLRGMASLSLPPARGKVRMGVETVFLFPGQGAQHPFMAQGYYRHHAVVRETIDECAALLQPKLGLDLRELLFQPSQEGETQLRQTAYAQPAIFVVSYAIAKFWLSQGVKPAALIGHSLGEYVAACLAGVFSLEDALDIVAERGRMTQLMPPGAMLAVSLSQHEVQQQLTSFTDQASLSLAAINSADQCVLAGTERAITGVENYFRERSPAIIAQRLKTSHAFHSALLEPMMASFAELIASKPRRAPNLPVISNVTGALLTPQQSLDPHYWAQHLRQPVNFHAGLQTLAGLLEQPLFMEAGPGQTLTALVNRFYRGNPAQSQLTTTIASLPKASANQGGEAGLNADYCQYLTAVGQLWQQGIDQPRQALFEKQSGRRVSLPTYPFERESYWIAPGPLARLTQADLDAMTRVETSAVYYALPQWVRSTRLFDSQQSTGSKQPILIFANDSSLSSTLTDQLATACNTLLTVRAGAGFADLGERHFQINPDVREDYVKLFNTLAERQQWPELILHLWACEDTPAESFQQSLESAQQQGFLSVLWLAQALEHHLSVQAEQACAIAVITQNLYDIQGSENLCPEWATLMGAVRIIPQEYPRLTCRLIDVAHDEAQLPQTCERLQRELSAADHPATQTIVALRGKHRWTPQLQALNLPDTLQKEHSLLRQNGVYLITGGLGGVGVQLARHLVQHWQASVVLLGRQLPERGKVERRSERRSERRLGWALTEDVPNIQADLRQAYLESEITALESMPGLLDCMNAYCTAEILGFLQAVGIEINPQQRYSLTDWQDQLQVQFPYRKFFRFMLNTLVADGLVQSVGDEQFIFTAKAEAPGLTTQQLKAQAVALCPGIEPMLSLVGHCARHYAEVLSGRLDGIAVLYPEGQSTLLQQVSETTIEHEDATPCYLAIKQLVCRILENHSAADNASAPLRILEIGGGKGILTGMLAPELAGKKVHYHFTDIGKSFVVDVEREAKARSYDFMTFGVLDITRDPVEQGYEGQAFDVIVGLDVVHATPDIAHTLSMLKRLLKPAGVLALSESCRPVRWKEMIWGVTKDWWAFSDAQRQVSGSPLMTPDQWRACFTEWGSGSVQVLTQNSNEEALAYSCVVIAQAAAEDQHSALQALLAKREQVLVCQADVCDRDSLAAAKTEAIRRFGRINGVIHAAGVEDRQTIARYTCAQDAHGLGPKVYGTVKLAECFADEPLDFLLLCSSLSAISGGIGDSVYMAANSFIDQYAHYLTDRVHYPCLAVNWDRWQGTGQALPFEIRHRQRTGQPLPGGLSPLQALQAFDALMQKNVARQLSQIIVTGTDLTQASLKRPWVEPNEPTKADTKPADARPKAANPPAQPGLQPSLHQRPQLATAYVAPKGETEASVAEVWQTLLGIEGIGVEDDYNALGGDSLLAIRIISHLRDRFQVQLDVRDIFEFPTIARLADRVDTILWAQKHEEKPVRTTAITGTTITGTTSTGTPNDNTIPRRYHGESHGESFDAPLSFAQQRLWFLYRYNGPNPAYNILMGCRLTGRLDVELLQFCVNVLQRRHPALRTLFVEAGEAGEAVQRILPPGHVPLELIDCRAQSSTQQAQTIAEFQQQLGETVIQLETGPVVSITLLQWSDEHYHLYMVMHHIVGDGWSLGVIREELNSLYQQLANHRQSFTLEQAAQLLPQPPIHYADYAWWQQQHFAGGQHLADQLRQWAEILRDAPPLLNLKPGHPRPPRMRFHGDVVPIRINHRQLAGLKALAQQSGASLFMIVLAVFVLLLQRYSGQKDIVVGAQAAGRGRRELENLVGFFINTLALRNILDPQLSFEEFLQQVKHNTLTAFSLQETPFEQLVDHLQLERAVNYNPLVQVMILWQNAPMGRLAMHDVEIEPLTLKNAAAKFDLTLELCETESGIEGVLEYSKDLFDHAFIAGMAEHFLYLLDEVLAQPSKSIAHYNLSSPETIAKQTAAHYEPLNGTRLLPDALSLAQHFEQTARKNPDGVAVAMGDESLSYAALNRRANQLAALLIASDYSQSQNHLQPPINLQPKIGILLPRCPETIIAILAILKSGAAYVPLDCSFPAQRLNQMLTIADVSMVITQSDYKALATAATGETGKPIICLDQLSFDSLPLDPLPENVSSPRDLAYVIFTSGTTGQPKGVMIEQASVAHLINALNETIYKSLTAGETENTQRIALMASTVFDASVQQIFAALLLGHSLYLIDDKARLDPALLQDFFLRHEITVSDCTPSLLTLMVNHGVLAHPQLALKQLIVGGEALPLSLVERALQACPNLRLTNVYGPTEACVDVTWKHFTAGQIHAIETTETIQATEIGHRIINIAPLGRPLPGCRLEVVDESGRILPEGLIGEMIIFGPGLARGYLLHPETEAQVVSESFQINEKGERYYRTGDLGYWTRTENGNAQLHVIGRNDHQVKIRGYRIELGEVEHQLARLAQVKQAAVLALPVVATEQLELVAFVALHSTNQYKTDQQQADQAALHQSLSKVLPEYMIPSRFIVLTELPLNLSGKVDRAALRNYQTSTQLNASPIESGAACLAPRNANETLLLSVWEAVLMPGVSISVTDNFFMVGGDSIKALQIVARLREKHFKLSVQAIFENPTIEALAQELIPLNQANNGQAAQPGAPHIGKLPLSPIQRRFFEQHAGDYRHFNQSLLLTVSDAVDAGRLRQAIYAVADHYECFRLRFRTEAGEGGGQWRQAVVASGRSVDFQWVNLASLSLLTQHAETTQRSINLQDGPLLKVNYYQTPEGCRLLLVAHHLIMDAVSWRIFTDSVGRVYHQLSEGQAVHLLPQSCYYSTWLKALQTYAQTRALQARDYWLAVEAQLPTTLPESIPVTQPTCYRDLRTKTLRLSAELTTQLLTQANRAFNTEVNDLLLTALALSVAAWLKCPSVGVLLEGHGRQPFSETDSEHLDLSNAMGWFTCAYPVVFQIDHAGDHASDLTKAIKRCKETLHQVPNKGLSYGVLRYLTDTDLGQCQPWLSFNYLGQVDSTEKNTLFSRANEAIGPAIDPNAVAPYSLEVVSMVQAGCLELDVVYDHNKFAQQTIEDFTARLLAELETLIRYASGCRLQEITPSDIDYDGFDSDQLDEFIDGLESA